MIANFTKGMMNVFTCEIKFAVFELVTKCIYK